MSFLGLGGRSYSGGRFALDIGNHNVGFLKKFSGLSMEADIATNDLCSDNVQKKHVSNVKWTPGKATIGIGMGKTMYDWIQAAFEKGHVRKDGELTVGVFDYVAMQSIEFRQALITSVTVPKLQGGSKEAAYFDIEFDPETVLWKPGNGQKLQSKVGPKQKAWLCQNFMVKIDGLPCQRVHSVDSFTWKCAVAPDDLGCFKEPTKHPVKVTVPDLKLSISYADHQAWAEAARKWFIGGEHEEQHEYKGEIIFLPPNMDERNPLGSIELKNVGFKKISDEDSEANSDKIKRFNVELYVEQMRFNLNHVDA
jgi:hypothetical protein